MQLSSMVKDKRGRIVVWQWPSPALYGWLFFGIASRLLSDGKLQAGCAVLSRSFLFVWAYLELTSGVNYFRKLLGFAVLAVLIINSFT